jgi:hypothetical protein
MHTFHQEGSRRIDPDQSGRLQSHLLAGVRVCAQKAMPQLFPPFREGQELQSPALDCKQSAIK